MLSFRPLLVLALLCPSLYSFAQSTSDVEGVPYLRLDSSRKTFVAADKLESGKVYFNNKKRTWVRVLDADSEQTTLEALSFGSIATSSELFNDETSSSSLFRLIDHVEKLSGPVYYWVPEQQSEFVYLRELRHFYDVSALQVKSGVLLTLTAEGNLRWVKRNPNGESDDLHELQTNELVPGYELSTGSESNFDYVVFNNQSEGNAEHRFFEPLNAASVFEYQLNEGRFTRVSQLKADRIYYRASELAKIHSPEEFQQNNPFFLGWFYIDKDGSEKLVNKGDVFDGAQIGLGDTFVGANLVVFNPRMDGDMFIWENLTVAEPSVIPNNIVWQPTQGRYHRPLTTRDPRRFYFGANGVMVRVLDDGSVRIFQRIRPIRR